MAALVQPNDIEAWSNVLICICNNYNDYKYLLPHVISTAYKINGEEFISQLSQVVERMNLPRKAKTEIINIICNYVHESKEIKDRPPIIRLFKPDGSYKEQIIKRPGE